LVTPAARLRAQSIARTLCDRSVHSNSVSLYILNYQRDNHRRWVTWIFRNISHTRYRRYSYTNF
jgi:hypothetical protein